MLIVPVATVLCTYILQCYLKTRLLKQCYDNKALYWISTIYSKHRTECCCNPLFYRVSENGKSCQFLQPCLHIANLITDIRWQRLFFSGNFIATVRPSWRFTTVLPRALMVTSWDTSTESLNHLFKISLSSIFQSTPTSLKVLHPVSNCE